MIRDLGLQSVKRLLERARGRPAALLGPGARLLRSAKIVNMGGRAADIQIGSGSIVRGELVRMAHGGRISIGRNCYVGAEARVWSGARISVGDFTLIAHNVNIFDNLTHPIDFMQRRAHFLAIAETGHPNDIDLEDAPVIIGNDAWIGAYGMILKGVSIGDRAIVAAGSVVTRDVPCDTLVGGNPARPLRSLL